MNAQRAIVYGMLASAGIVIAAERRLPEPRVLIGGAVVFFAIGMVPDPGLAKSFAALIVVGTLFLHGERAFGTISNKTRKKDGKSVGTPTRRSGR